MKWTVHLPYNLVFIKQN